MDPWQPCADPATPNPISGSDTDSITNAVDLALSNNTDEKNQNLKERDENPVGSPEQIINSNSGSGGQQGDGDSSVELSFSDNFQPFIKLPDSDQYLESLERKLKVIQKGGRKGPSADSIIRSLGQTKESCMIKLLSNSVEKITAEEEIFQELKVNPLLKKLTPERQALTTEELVHLLKADQLELILGVNNDSEPEPSTSTVTEERIEITPAATEVDKDAAVEPSSE